MKKKTENKISDDLQDMDVETQEKKVVVRAHDSVAEFLISLSDEKFARYIQQIGKAREAARIIKSRERKGL